MWLKIVGILLVLAARNFYES